MLQSTTKDGRKRSGVLLFYNMETPQSERRWSGSGEGMGSDGAFPRRVFSTIRLDSTQPCLRSITAEFNRNVGRVLKAR